MKEGGCVYRITRVEIMIGDEAADGGAWVNEFPLGAMLDILS